MLHCIVKQSLKLFYPGVSSIPIKKIDLFYEVAFGDIHRISPITRWVVKRKQD